MDVDFNRLMEMSAETPYEMIKELAAMCGLEISREVNDTHLNEYLYFRAKKLYEEQKKARETAYKKEEEGLSKEQVAELKKGRPKQFQVLAVPPSEVMSWFRHYLSETEEYINNEMHPPKSKEEIAKEKKAEEERKAREADRKKTEAERQAEREKKLKELEKELVDLFLKTNLAIVCKLLK